MFVSDSVDRVKVGRLKIRWKLEVGGGWALMFENVVLSNK